MPWSLPCPSPLTSEWAVPRVAGRFSDSETSWVLPGGTEGSFLCSLSSRFSGRGGGRSEERRWGRGVGLGGRRIIKKKNGRMRRLFLHQISLESKLNGRQKVKGGNGSIHCLNLYVTHCLTHCLAHCLAHRPEPRSGLCPELLADFRIPKPPGCSQGAQRAVFCAVRVADFLAEGAGWGASPGRGGRVWRVGSRASEGPGRPLPDDGVTLHSDGWLFHPALGRRLPEISADQRRAQVPCAGRAAGQSAPFQRGTAYGTGRACLLQRGAGLHLLDHHLRSRQGPTRRRAGLNCRPPAFLQTLTKVPQRGTQVL